MSMAAKRIDGFGHGPGSFSEDILAVHLGVAHMVHGEDFVEFRALARLVKLAHFQVNFGHLDHIFAQGRLIVERRPLVGVGAIDDVGIFISEFQQISHAPSPKSELVFQSSTFMMLGSNPSAVTSSTSFAELAASTSAQVWKASVWQAHAPLSMVARIGPSPRRICTSPAMVGKASLSEEEAPMTVSISDASRPALARARRAAITAISTNVSSLASGPSMRPGASAPAILRHNSIVLARTWRVLNPVTRSRSSALRGSPRRVEI